MNFLDEAADFLWYKLASTMMENEETTYSIMEKIVPGRFDSSRALKLSLQKELRKLDRESDERERSGQLPPKED